MPRDLFDQPQVSCSDIDNDARTALATNATGNPPLTTDRSAAGP
jgi:hypothetical protein